MAADILLYNADLVPVGDDQKQHLELTRDLAQRFNQRFGQTFTVPDPYIPQVGGRIMSLDDASKKMSKSNPNPASYIALLDPPDVIRKKMSRAVTDSGNEVKYDAANKPEISNLISIYANFSDLSIAQIEAKYEGQGYGAFKKDLAEQVVAKLEPIQQRYHEIRQSGEINDILSQGAEDAKAIADPILREAKYRMGFLLP
jgi:tryptophanyl-tRNA synthetase